MSDSNTSDVRDDQSAEVIARLYELIQQLKLMKSAISF